MFNNLSANLRNFYGALSLTAEGGFQIITIGAENIRVNSANGFVGIGNPATLTSLLTVNGSITQSVTSALLKTNASGTIVAAVAGTDYVIPSALSSYVPTSRTITINGTAFDLSADRSYSVGTVTSVGLSSATSGVTIGSSPITTSGTITLAIATASGSQNGLLSSADWNTFNNAATGSFLPLSGGTLSGNLIVNGSTNTPLKITATEPYMEIQSNGSTNVCGIKFLPSTGYDAYVGNYGSGKLWLIAGNADNAYVDTNGDLFNRTGVYGTISDITLKENIVDATPKLDDLLKLKVRNFNFIGNDKKQLGFIAQEFEDVFPNAISIDNGYGDNNGKKVVKTTVLIPMLVKAIQELKAEIDELKRNNG